MPAIVWIETWHQAHDKQLSEQMITEFVTQL